MAETTSSPTLKITTTSDLEIVMTRVFDAPRALLWDALTKPQHIVHWFGGRQGTMAVCEVDLRVGGQACYIWQFADGSQMGIRWVYREVTPPERMVHTETFDEPYTEEMGGETLVTWLLEESNDATTLTATTLYNSSGDRDRVLQSGFEEGAAETFDRLEELLRQAS